MGGREEDRVTDRDGPHLHEQDFGTSIRGTGGSPAPDKGHDRLAARCLANNKHLIRAADKARMHP